MYAIRSYYDTQISANLVPGQLIVFASGYNIAFDLIAPPREVDVALIAPRMIGIGVRETFVAGSGFRNNFV